MSDELDQAPVGAAPQGLTAGAMLRQAREAAGLHAAAMAVSLKVPVGKLEALEQDRYDLLPDAVFTRALASSICRTLKIDPQPVLERLPQTSAPRLVQDSDGINTPFRSPGDQLASGWREQFTRPVSLVVGVLVIGAAVVLLLPHTQWDERAAAAIAAAPSTPPAAPATIAPATTAPQPAEPLLPASMTVPASGQPPAETSPASTAPNAQGAQPAPTVQPGSAAPAAAASATAVPAAGDDALVFHATATSWIEVRDAKGAVPIRKELAAGESASVSGTPPLKVVVGNVRATELQVRGKPFDLTSIARDNVARFEVK